VSKSLFVLRKHFVSKGKLEVSGKVFRTRTAAPVFWYGQPCKLMCLVRDRKCRSNEERAFSAFQIAIHCICVYTLTESLTMSIHSVYLVSDLEDSDIGDPLP
jgi:hypothetical protein